MEKPTETTDKPSEHAIENAAAATSGPAHHHWTHKHKRLLIWLGAILAILLLIWLIWHKPLSRAWDNLFGVDPNTAATQASVIDPQGALTGTGGGGGGTTTTGQRNNATSDAATRETVSRTTTTTTTTSTPTPETPGGETPSAVTTGLLNLSTNAGVGLTREQLINLANGQLPSSCTDISLANLISQSVCTWTADGKSVVVTLQGNKVIGAPIKIGF